ncbi:hypothetical protein [Desulfohalovibrio reitneri]|uniref:hypothetical protein n=1 Tax=Desulfohalovibrio reitneri TaxID=1307759 RepID=UPI0004A76A3D|nr:hypothetical protein [Desulfohalovibrio reitneri]
MEAQNTEDRATPYLDLSFARSAKDMAVAALLLSFVALAAAGAVFFTARSDTSGLEEQTATLQQRLTGFEQQMATFDARLDQVANLPEEVRTRIMMQQIEQMKAGMAAMAGQMEGDFQAKVEQAMDLLDEAASGLSGSATP